MAGDATVVPADAGTGVDAAGGDAASEPDRQPFVAVPVPLDVRVQGLAGTGLRLRSARGEEQLVAADGTVRFALPLTDEAGGATLEVVSQPTAPSQRCTVELVGLLFSVACETQAYAVGGEVIGLAGPGLVLAGSWGESLPIAASGAFRFEERLPDLSEYAVSVVSAPTSPLQTCTVEQAVGSVSGEDVSGVRVVCTTHRFGFSGTVSGLLGTGLVLELVEGDSASIAADGAFAFAQQLPDGSPYVVRVKQQPRSPDQRCVVLNGVAQLAGADAEIKVVCGALGGLRLSEVGSCHYADSACWVELYNAGDAAEELSYYQLRTQAAERTAPYRVQGEHVFTLPSATLAKGARVVVRARSHGALPDGQGVLHVADGDYLPWWSGDGFVELTTAGQSIDFVRFGDSEAAPTTSSSWAGGSAEALPNGASGHGYALARDRANTDSDRSGDWVLRAFATPGGPNDVTSDTDNDGDGLPDAAEQPGATFAGIDIYAMGARVGPRDLFIEIDRMDSSDAAVVPRREALEKLVHTFAARGFALHFDVGSLFSSRFDPAQHNLGGGSVVPFAQAVGFGGEGEIADLYAYKAAHMEAARRSFFYYVLFAWSQLVGGGGGSSGIGERPGNDSIITLGGWGLEASSTTRKNLVINYQAATLMHELGHNLGLRHGGGDDLNRKPNYVSVMNYLYSPLGLPTIGRSEGDRYDIYRRCSLYSILLLTNPPTGTPESFLLDYSDGYSGDLLESSVLEADGLGRTDSRSVDYNCNRKSDAAYASDLNGDGRQDVLMDHDDWTNLDIVFRRSYSGNENGPTPWFQGWVSPTHDDVLTDDTQRVSEQPCPPPALPRP